MFTSRFTVSLIYQYDYFVHTINKAKKPCFFHLCLQSYTMFNGWQLLKIQQQTNIWLHEYYLPTYPSIHLPTYLSINCLSIPFYLYNLGIGGKEKRILTACWLISLTKKVNSWFCETLSQSTKNDRKRFILLCLSYEDKQTHSTSTLMYKYHRHIPYISTPVLSTKHADSCPHTLHKVDVHTFFRIFHVLRKESTNEK